MALPDYIESLQQQLFTSEQRRITAEKRLRELQLAIEKCKDLLAKVI